MGIAFFLLIFLLAITEGWGWRIPQHKANGIESLEYYYKYVSVLNQIGRGGDDSTSPKHVVGNDLDLDVDEVVSDEADIRPDTELLESFQDEVHSIRKEIEDRNHHMSNELGQEAEKPSEDHEDHQQGTLDNPLVVDDVVEKQYESQYSGHSDKKKELMQDDEEDSLTYQDDAKDIHQDETDEQRINDFAGKNAPSGAPTSRNQAPAQAPTRSSSVSSRKKVKKIISKDSNTSVSTEGDCVDNSDSIESISAQKESIAPTVIEVPKDDVISGLSNGIKSKVKKKKNKRKNKTHQKKKKEETGLKRSIAKTKVSKVLADEDDNVITPGEWWRAALSGLSLMVVCYFMSVHMKNTQMNGGL